MRVLPAIICFLAMVSLALVPAAEQAGDTGSARPDVPLSVDEPYQEATETTPGDRVSPAGGSGGGTRASTDWPMFRGDQRRTGNISTAPPGSNTEIWKKSIGYDAYSSAAIVGDDVFVGSTSGFYCFDLLTGNQNWKATSYTGIYTSSPAVVNGKVYVGANDNKLHCFNASTGSEYWAYTTGGIVESSPVVVGSAVYVASNDHKLYSITTSGGLNWATTALSSSDLSSSPAYYNGYLYIGSAHDYGGDEEVYSIDASDGSIEWTHTLDSDVVCTPAVAYGNVYVTDYNGKAYCLDAAGNGDGTTDVIWTHAGTAHTGTWSCASGALANGRYIYATGGMGGATSVVYSVNAYGNGMGGTTQYWTFVKSGSYGWQASVAVANGRVLVAYAGSSSGDTLYCLDESTGSEYWNYAGLGSSWGLDSGPAVSSGYAVFGDSNGMLYCVGGAVIPPLVESVSPTDGSVGVALDTSVMATFDMPMGAASINLGSFSVVDSGGNPVTGTVDYDAMTDTAVFNPTGDLAEGETYTATLTGAVASAIGAGLDGDGDGEAEGSPDDDYVWSFTTVELNAPALSAIPVQEPVEEVDHVLDITSYVSDDDTPLGELVMTHNSSHAISQDGFALTLNYPEGVMWEDVNISVSDGAKMTWQTVRFDVTPVNDDPALAPIPVQTGEEETEFRLDVTDYITDIDTPVDSDHFTLEADSDHVEVDSLELVFNYTEGMVQDSFTLTVTDHGAHETDDPCVVDAPVSVSVTPVNDPPVLLDPGAQTVDEDTYLNITFDVTDPDSVTFTAGIENADGGELPGDISLDEDTLTMSFLPSNDDVGLWNFTVTVVDGGGLDDAVTFPVTVLNTNDAPPASVISWNVVDAWPKTMKVENLTVTFSCAEVEDPDGDELTYRWDFDASDGADDGVTGLEAVHTYPFEGDFTVTLTVDDGNGGTAPAALLIPVFAPPEPEEPDDSDDEPVDGTPDDGGTGGPVDDDIDGGDTDPEEKETSDDEAGALEGDNGLMLFAVIAAVVVGVIVAFMVLRRKKKDDGGAVPAGHLPPQAPGAQAAPMYGGAPAPMYGEAPGSMYGEAPGSMYGAPGAGAPGPYDAPLGGAPPAAPLAAGPEPAPALPPGQDPSMHSPEAQAPDYGFAAAEPADPAPAAGPEYGFASAEPVGPGSVAGPGLDIAPAGPDGPVPAAEPGYDLPPAEPAPAATPVGTVPEDL